MFVIHHVQKGALPALETIQAGGGTASGYDVKIGLALCYTAASGAQKCPATSKPQYIAMQSAKVPMMGKLDVLAIPVDEETVYETTLSVDGASLEVGDKVTLSADGMQVTATTTGGVATIVAFPDGKGKDAKVLVKFM